MEHQPSIINTKYSALACPLVNTLCVVLLVTFGEGVHPFIVSFEFTQSVMYVCILSAFL